MFIHQAIKGMRKTKKLLQVELFLLIALFSPILIIQRPLWDGVLIKFGEQNKFSYLNSAALDYSFPLQYAPEMILSFISRSTKINFYALYCLALVLVLLALLRSILKISKLLGMGRPSKNQRFRIAILYAFFAPFHVLYSTQNFIFVVCIFFCLEGLVNLSSPKFERKIFGMFLILFSFQMPSMPFLGFALYLGIIAVRKSLNLIGIIRNAIIPAIFCASYLILVREVFFPPSGLYEKYNKVVINQSSLMPAIQNLSNFIVFILPLVIVIFFAAGNLVILNVKSLNVLKRFDSSEKNQLFYLLFLAGFTALPYILANKSPYKFDFFDWSYRHALPLVVPITLFSIWVTNFRHRQSKNFKGRIHLLASSFAIFVLGLSTLSGAYGHVQSMLMDKKLVSDFKEIDLAKFDSGVVCINYLNPRLNNPRFYELNALAWEATGLVNWQLYGDQNCQEVSKPEEILYGSALSNNLNSLEWKNLFLAGTNSEDWTRIDIRSGFPLDFIFRELKDFLN